jgi:hypothetical protein
MTSAIILNLILAASAGRDCTSSVKDRDGTLFGYNGSDTCRNVDDRPWACYRTVAYTCRDRETGEETTDTFTGETGVCAASLSDCW